MVHNCALYCMTKAAVIALMETLASDLQGTNVGASVFAPVYRGQLACNLKEVRPQHLQNDSDPVPPAPAADQEMPEFDFSKLLMSAEEAGERVLRGVRRQDLYILTHTEFKEGLRKSLMLSCALFPTSPLMMIFIKLFSFLITNPIYETQTTPGPLKTE